MKGFVSGIVEGLNTRHGNIPLLDATLLERHMEPYALQRVGKTLRAEGRCYWSYEVDQDHGVFRIDCHGREDGSIDFIAASIMHAQLLPDSTLAQQCLGAVGAVPYQHA